MTAKLYDVICGHDGGSDTPRRLLVDFDLFGRGRESPGFFKNIIDKNPKDTFILRTSHPERVRELWPLPEWTSTHRFQGVTDFGRYQHRSNVHLYISATTQAEVDARMQHARGLAGLVPVVGLWIEPMEDALDIRHWFDGPLDEVTHLNGIQHVVARGGDKPVHPDWIRRLRDDFKAAGVPFWFDGWGKWIHSSHDLGPNDPRVTDCMSHKAIGDGTLFSAVGTNIAGRLIDGVECCELPLTKGD